MLKNKLKSLLLQAAQEAQKKGICPPGALPEIVIEQPPKPDLGDYASSLPLKLARGAGIKPMALAESLAKLLPPSPEVSRVEIAPPGFINFTLSEKWLKDQVDAILAEGDSYGSLDLGQGKKLQVEFVSANPTGPLHIGHGRGAVLGSTLASVLAAVGYQVSTEYYINDAGSQMDNFYASLYARYQQVFGVQSEIPAGGYAGEYVLDLAKEIAKEEGDRFMKMPREQAVKEIGSIGVKRMLAGIAADLSLIDIDFDVWFSEQSLYLRGEYEKAMELLHRGGYVAKKEGATWFVSTALGESKDNVLVRSDGTPTYFASDIAYHYNKFVVRGLDKVIDIWGADHQGHVSRVRTAIEALGINPERLKVIISQMVTLKRGDQVVKASKRTGEFITLQEVIEEVGPDACRFFFLARAADSQMDFDLELAKKQSLDNPVYYIQYAHARIASIFRLAEEKKLDYTKGDVSLLSGAAELALIRKMILLPEVIESVATTLEPHYLPYYAQELATIFHSFYMQCRVVSDDRAATEARLKLVKAARHVLSRVLGLMGMAVPERM